jgi:hypothetical protein
MDVYMKQLLVDIDDRCARDLERVAPAKERKRSEFIRLAIRRAIDLAMDRVTADAYARYPLGGELTPDDLEGWDQENRLATLSESRARRPYRGRATKRVT